MTFGGTPILTLRVGPDQLAFHVHQNILFDASPVFKTAFSGSFKEASEQSMSLPDDDKDAVECMIQWLYTKRIVLTVSVSLETTQECYMQLARLNSLAEKYDIRSLRNDIIDEFFVLKSVLAKPPQMPPVKHVYDTTGEQSSLRKLLVAWSAYHINFDWYEKDTTKDALAEVPPDFVIDLAIELGLRHKYPSRKSPFTRPSKDFHESAPNEPQEKST